MQSFLEKLISGRNLSAEEASTLMTHFMNGEVDHILGGALLTALQIKGVVLEELVAFVQVMRQKAISVDLKQKIVVDTCGTGGDQTGTFNISTTAAFVVAAAGHSVAKHGNRAITSNSGSADLFEALGVSLSADPAQVCNSVARAGIAFLFAPHFHASVAHVGPIRQALKIKTVFNMLGPLCNPAGANVQLLGVFDPSLVALMAEALLALGSKRAYVVHGLEDGLDEVSLCGPTQIAHLDADKDESDRISSFSVVPEDFGFTRASIAELRGATPAENAPLSVAILGNEHQGPKKDAVLLNAGFALAAAEKITPADGIEKSRTIIEQKLALGVLEKARSAAC